MVKRVVNDRGAGEIMEERMGEYLDHIVAFIPAARAFIAGVVFDLIATWVI